MKELTLSVTAANEMAKESKAQSSSG